MKLREALDALTTWNLLALLDTCFYPETLRVTEHFDELSKLQITNTAKMSAEDPVTGRVS